MDTWTYDFDECLKRYFAIDHIDAGMSEQDLARYRHLTPQEAALAFGQDCDLNRVDGPWGC